MWDISNVSLVSKAVTHCWHVSSRLMFDEKLKDGEYAVDAPTNPLNEYGRTKLLGEQAVEEILD